MSPRTENKEEDQEELLEKIYEDGDVVFSKTWDTESIGEGGDGETVHCLDGRYVVASSEGLSGPYDSLETALKENDLLMIDETTESIECDLLPAEEIVKMAWSPSDEPFTITINGEEWEFEKSLGFRKAFA